MKFTIKKFSFILIIGLLTTFSFTSCNDDDGYSLDKFVISLATVNPLNPEQGLYYLTLDNGTTLFPAATNVFYKPTANQRVIVNYTLLSDKEGDYDHFVNINDIANILTKNIVGLTPENEKEIGDDPIDILQLWTGDDYLNIRFQIMVSGESIQHAINLVLNDQAEIAMEDDAFVLELKQNAHNDRPMYPSTGYAAFNLKTLQVKGRDSVNLKIKAKNYNGQEKSFLVTYKYNESKSSEKNLDLNEIPQSNSVIK